uniref:Uncharacterized protein n=1 Tax=Meloidogyne hapla TaxID=6305 RepID=A0A1I8BJ44_MELHA
MDQCMLRPGQKALGSYGLIFQSQPGIFCEELLICYPSQLSGNNTLNGTLSSIPYRIKAKRNEVTKKCEEKRIKFCNQPNNKDKCSVGQPGSSTWHGIMIKIDYYGNDFITTIYLSITYKNYTFINMPLFYIEFGRKGDIFTKIFPMAVIESKTKTKYIKQKEAIIPIEELLKNEFLSNADKGGYYLNKYTGLWSLGMDLLPLTAQRSLHLFFYRGCICEVDVWFRKPTTPSTAIPTINNNIKDKNLLRDKICKLFTNNTMYPLGNITEKEKLVEFKLKTSNVGESGIIELFDNETVVLKINFNKSAIEFLDSGNYSRYSRDFQQNLLQIGATINVTMRLNKYSVYTSIEIKDFPIINYKFFPKFWWHGRLFEISNNSYLLIHGDFVIITPVNVRGFNEYTLTDKMGQIIQMPHSFKFGEFIRNNTLFRYRCLLNDNAEWFYIRLRQNILEENKYGIKYFIEN